MPPRSAIEPFRVPIERVWSCRSAEAVKRESGPSGSRIRSRVKGSSSIDPAEAPGVKPAEEGEVEILAPVQR
jgi:hypothetical protein